MAQINASSAIESFEGVKTRLLADHERPFSTVDQGTPLVIEPGAGRGVSALSAFLAQSSEQVKQALYAHGALLFRGFSLADEAALERAVRSLRGVHPMSSYFMSEPGRELAGGTKSVFNTNSYKRTGGSVALSGFHSENFYSADVPQLQVFWCKTRPWLGGETGLIHMSHAYAELDPALQAKIEGEPVGAVQWTLAQVAEAYGLSEARAEAFFREQGLLGARADGQKVVNLHKPPVYRHPQLGTRSLQVNLSGEVRGTTPLLERLFAPSYQGPQWALHRLAWRKPLVAQAWGRVERLPATLRYPQLVGKEEWAIVKGMVKSLRAPAKKRSPGAVSAVPLGGTRRGSPAPVAGAPYGMTPLARRLDAKDVEALARAVRRHCTVFTWQTGDILLFDNLQMLHGGMPGLGPRTIRVMMCNPVPLRYPFVNGVAEVNDDPSFRSLDERLRALASTPEKAEPAPRVVEQPQAQMHA